VIPSTHWSLLAALHGTAGADTAWGRFHDRYRETIHRWCLRRGLQPADAEDVTQGVLARLWKPLPDHPPDPTRPFRAWLKAVVENAVRDYLRTARRHPADHAAGGSSARDRLADLEAPAASDDLAAAIEAEPDPDLAATVGRVKERVGERAWQAFWRLTVDGVTAAAAAAELGMTVGAVYQAKYRVGELLAREYPGPGDGSVADPDRRAP
jgi:RNA polymerase sigma-70 factor (ECF subfamily)